MSKEYLDKQKLLEAFEEYIRERITDERGFLESINTCPLAIKHSGKREAAIEWRERITKGEFDIESPKEDNKEVQIGDVRRTDVNGSIPFVITRFCGEKQYYRIFPDGSSGVGDLEETKERTKLVHHDDDWGESINWMRFNYEL